MRFDYEAPKIALVRRFVIALAVFIPAVGACSSDAAPLPEPTVRQAGAFVAIDRGGLELMLTLKSVRLDSDTLIFTTLYDVRPASFEHARELARQANIPIRQELVFESENLIQMLSHRVVWFRTLTRAEEDRAL